MSSSELINAVNRRGGELRLETLAYLARYAHGNSHHGVELLEAVIRPLLKRVRPIAMSVGTTAGKTTEDWEDGTQHAVFSMLRDFQSKPTEELTFWEVNLPYIFKRRCIDGVVSCRRKIDRSSVPLEGVTEDVEVLHARLAGPLDQLVVREILSILPPDEATAARLRWFDGFPVSGHGSVSELMNVSRKTVHDYLARAKAKVMEDPRFQAWTEGG